MYSVIGSTENPLATLDRVQQLPFLHAVLFTHKGNDGSNVLGLVCARSFSMYSLYPNFISVVEGWEPIHNCLCTSSITLLCRFNLTLPADGNIRLYSRTKEHMWKAALVTVKAWRLNMKWLHALCLLLYTKSFRLLVNLNSEANVSWSNLHEPSLAAQVYWGARAMWRGVVADLTTYTDIHWSFDPLLTWLKIRTKLCFVGVRYRYGTNPYFTERLTAVCVESFVLGLSYLLRIGYISCF